jgi:hypothetical protein
MNLPLNCVNSRNENGLEMHVNLPSPTTTSSSIFYMKKPSLQCHPPPFHEKCCNRQIITTYCLKPAWVFSILYACSSVAHCKRQLLSLLLFDQNQPPSKRSKNHLFHIYAVVNICCFYILHKKVSRRISCQFFDQFHCAQNFDQILIEIKASLLLYQMVISDNAQFRTLRFQRLSYLFAMMFL